MNDYYVSKLLPLMSEASVTAIANLVTLGASQLLFDPASWRSPV